MKEYLVGQLQYCGNKALESTCQLFYKAKAIGSGIFIEIGTNKYLVSAAHVLEPEFVNRMTIPNGEILIEIQGILLVTNTPTGKTRKEDDFDIAAVQLTEDCCVEIEKRFRFLTINEIDLEHIKLKSHQYMFCGYPVENTDVDNMKMDIDTIPLKVRTKITDKELLEIPKYPFGLKWILDYDRNRQINVLNQNEQLSPHPIGISGAGLWSIPVNPNVHFEATNMKLIGIMTDYFESNYSVICATNIKLILDIITTHFENKN